MANNEKILLAVKNLKTYFFTSKGSVKAVDDVTLSIKEGETVGLVGESGCGKSTVALSIMRLIPTPGRIVAGEILFKGLDLISLPMQKMKMIRGGKIAMSFQDPTTFFNPVMRIGDQIGESIIHHKNLAKSKALEETVELLELVGISSPRDVAFSYPHQLSGGMRQRSMMAMALACNPDLLIADEPTTALDTLIQAQLLDLMKDLKRKLNMSSLIISHDFGVIAELCEKIAVMYAGQIVEYSDIQTILRKPSHPYTFGLLNSIPRIGRMKKRLTGIEGSVPDLIDLSPGCRFSPRCHYSSEYCYHINPELLEVSKEHYVLCSNPLKG